MKKLLGFLLFLVLGFSCFSQETENLPKKTWEEIIEINSTEKEPIKKWGNDIHVKLEGNYTKIDSLNIEKILKKLNNLTETISINFSKQEEANFKIKFLDSFLKNPNERTLDSKRNWTPKKEYSSVELYIYKFVKTNSEIKKSLESQIARLLVGGYFDYRYGYKKRLSIFNVYAYLNNSNVPLNDDDSAIIKAVYTANYSEHLKQAEFKYKDKVLHKIQEVRISERDTRIWWVKNPIAVIILPFLILVLLSLFLINKAIKLITPKIKKDWLKFGAIALLVLFFTGVLIIFCVSFYDFLTIPDNYNNAPIIRWDTVLSTTLGLIVLFPVLYLFRFIELKIQKTVKSINTKTILIFLSTGFLPLLCLVLIFIFAIQTKDQKNIQGDYLVLSKMFLFFMSIASIRALIGYFIFKERNLIIENETKLSNLRELKVKAELKSLQSQINPHFLYNSLNSIASLAPIDAVKTQKMAHSLSDLFKYSINRKGKKMSTVLDEVEMVKTYLDIEKIRFGNRLQFTVDLDKELENKAIPLFLIQPLVENAVKHGISKKEGEGNIVLKIKEEANGMCISVSDSGSNFPEGLVSGHGLQTVYDLLRLSYGDSASLNWTNTPEKIITITIPQTV